MQISEKGKGKELSIFVQVNRKQIVMTVTNLYKKFVQQLSGPFEMESTMNGPSNFSSLIKIGFGKVPLKLVNF